VKERRKYGMGVLLSHKMGKKGLKEIKENVHMNGKVVVFI
jgi:hypothetical protein